MNNPSDEEINKTLAEFMDTRAIPFYDGCDGTELIIDDYTNSLDALVPIVEKVYTLVGNREMLEVFTFVIFKAFLNKESPSKALALACYKVVKERE